MYKNNFYKNLSKPNLTPKPIIFKIVWGTLYFFMLLSFLLVIFSPQNTLKYYAVSIFVLQLIFNIMWSPVFFLKQNMQKAFLISILLFFSVLSMVIIFYKINPISGMLQVPYLIWCAFASYLNYMFIKIN